MCASPSSLKTLFLIFHSLILSLSNVFSVDIGVHLPSRIMVRFIHWTSQQHALTIAPKCCARTPHVSLRSLSLSHFSWDNLTVHSHGSPDSMAYNVCYCWNCNRLWGLLTIHHNQIVRSVLHIELFAQQQIWFFEHNSSGWIRCFIHSHFKSVQCACMWCMEPNGSKSRRFCSWFLFLSFALCVGFRFQWLDLFWLVIELGELLLWLTAMQGTRCCLQH